MEEDSRINPGVVTLPPWTITPFAWRVVLMGDIRPLFRFELMWFENPDFLDKLMEWYESFSFNDKHGFNFAQKT